MYAAFSETTALPERKQGSISRNSGVPKNRWIASEAPTRLSLSINGDHPYFYVIISKE
jgi:hypothetical protein